MESKKLMRERISALADAALDEGQLQVALADLRSAEGRAAWEDYHQIGDLLRTEELHVEMSPDFNPRMSALLAQEPIHFAARTAAGHGGGAGRMPVFMRRMVMPGAAVAAVATFSFLMAPAVMQGLQGGGSGAAQVLVAADTPVATQGTLVVASSQAEPEGRAEKQPAVLRDPGLDEYLRAHQRFSPSVYSSAQFARTTTFVHDTSK